MLLNPYRFTAAGGGGALLTGLVSYWKMDEASGNAIDSHGTNHLTSVSNVGTAVGKIGNARDFEKDSVQYFSIPSNASLQTGDIDFTFTAWVRFESVGTRHPTIISKDDAINGEYLLMYHDSVQRIMGQMGASGTVYANALGVPSAGVWYFVVFGHDSTANKLSLQINNGTIDEVTSTSGPAVRTTVFKIGGYGPDNDKRPWDGLIDEVGFWKRTLTPAERTALYNAGNGLAYPFT